MIVVNLRSMCVLLAVAIAILVAAHFTLSSFEWAGARLFNLDSEASFGTALGSFLGLIAGLSAIVVGLARKRGQDRWLFWVWLGLALIVYAVDEVAQVHDGVSHMLANNTSQVEDVMAGTAFLGYLLLPAFLFAVWAGIRSSDRPAAILVGTGLCVFWLGGFGVEELEHMNYQGSLGLTQGMSMETGDFVLTGIQEAMELVGMALVLIGSLTQMAALDQAVSIEITDARD